MGPVHLKPESDLRDATRSAFDSHRRQIIQLMPGSEVEHVGSTAVPGALTKGDVDLLVRVSSDQFGRAVKALGDVYSVHQPDEWTPRYASFVAPGEKDPPVGVQVAVAGSQEDRFFGPFRDALIADPELLAEYNALKRRLDGAEYERYTDAKAEFVERTLRELGIEP